MNRTHGSIRNGWLWSFFSLLLTLGCGGSTAAAQPANGDVDVRAHGWVGGALAQTQIHVGADGSTFVGVWVDVPEQVARVQERTPLAISLVVDTSGSMAGNKIADARMAAASMLESLRDGDLVSIYAFSNSVFEIAPPTLIGPGTRGMLGQRIQMLQPGGGTNMYDGVRVGTTRLSESPPTHAIRRLVLISDGQANIGPSDPSSLGMLAARATEWGVQVSSIGVGLDYDERTLAALAIHSSGRFYHLQHSAQMASIIDQELNLLDRVVATNAFIEITPAPGVRVLDIQSPGATLEQNRIRVPLGTLHGGQKREILFRAQIDTAALGDHDAGLARLVYERPHGDRPIEQRAPLAYRVVRSQAEAERSAAPRVAEMVATHEAVEAQRHAAALLNEGRNREAAQALSVAAQQMQARAARAPSGGATRAMQRRAAELRGRASRAAGAAPGAASRSEALEMFDTAAEAEGF